MILLLTGCTVQSPEERFVNPLFYKTLYPISKNEVEIKLTPTRIYTKSIVSKRNCILLKNTKTELKFSCEYDDLSGEHISDVLYNYVLEEKIDSVRNCYIIQKNVINPTNDHIVGTSAYCVYLDE